MNIEHTNILDISTDENLFKYLDSLLSEKCEKEPVGITVNRALWDRLRKIHRAPPQTEVIFRGIEFYLKDIQTKPYIIFYDKGEMLDYLKGCYLLTPGG